MDQLKDRISKELVRLRTEAGLTVYQVAELIQTDHSVVYRWQNGKALPRPALGKKLDELFGVKVFTPSQHVHIRGKSFGDRLYAARKKAKLTLRDVQALTGLPFSTIATWETGKYGPKTQEQWDKLHIAFPNLK